MWALFWIFSGFHLLKKVEVSGQLNRGWLFFAVQCSMYAISYAGASKHIHYVYTHLCEGWGEIMY